MMVQSGVAGEYLPSDRPGHSKKANSKDRRVDVEDG